MIHITICYMYALFIWLSDIKIYKIPFLSHTILSYIQNYVCRIVLQKDFWFLQWLKLLIKIEKENYFLNVIVFKWSPVIDKEW